MIKDDYLLRMVRQAADAIALALAKSGEVDDTETERAIHEALRDVVRLPINTLVMLDQKSLAQMLASVDDGAARVLARGLSGLADIDEAALWHGRAWAITVLMVVLGPYVFGFPAIKVTKQAIDGLSAKDTVGVLIFGSSGSECRSASIQEASTTRSGRSGSGK